MGKLQRVKKAGLEKRERDAYYLEQKSGGVEKEGMEWYVKGCEKGVKTLDCKEMLAVGRWLRH